MIFPLILVAFAACQVDVTVELTDAEKDAMTEEVTSLHEQMWGEWRQVNLDAGIAYFRSDAVWGLMGDTRSGADNIKTWFEPMLAGVARQEIVFDDRQVLVVNRDVVYVMERGSYTAFDGDDAAVGGGPFAASVLWVRSDGEWRVVGGHESFPAPAPESM
jgi:uncharacterized protein (TIGR02246 family)